jgi:hypothetical protein
MSRVLDRFGQHLYHCDKRFSAPLRNKFHAFLKISVADTLAAPMRAVAVHAREPHLSAHFDPVPASHTHQSQSQDPEDSEVPLSTDSRADLLFNSADGTKAILIDVTSASGLSKDSRLQHYTPGAVAELVEQRKAKAYAKLWNMDAARAKLIFFAIELSGCLGPEAQGLCKVMAEVGGEGPEGLKSIYESLSIGFQVNRALRIEHMMKPR